MAAPGECIWVCPTPANKLCPELLLCASVHQEDHWELLHRIEALWLAGIGIHNGPAEIWQGHSEGMFHLTHPFHSHFWDNPDGHKDNVWQWGVSNSAGQQLPPLCSYIADVTNLTADSSMQGYSRDSKNCYHGPGWKYSLTDLQSTKVAEWIQSISK